MKRAVLSDIHGNLPALDAVLAHARKQGIQEYIFTGDLVGHGPNPEACIQLLEKLALTGIKGNNDKALCAGTLNIYNKEANASLEWAAAQLSTESRAWLERLSDNVLEIGDLLTIVHGTLMDPVGDYTYMYDNDSNIKMSFRLLKTPIGLFGHTHRTVVYTAIPKPSPFLFSFTTQVIGYQEQDGIEDEVYSFAEDLKAGKRLLACAGSIGQPRDGNYRASYMIVDEERQELQYYRIPYDRQAVFNDFEKIRKSFPQHGKIIDASIDRLNQGM